MGGMVSGKNRTNDLATDTCHAMKKDRLLCGKKSTRRRLLRVQAHPRRRYRSMAPSPFGAKDWRVATYRNVLMRESLCDEISFLEGKEFAV